MHLPLLHHPAYRRLIRRSYTPFRVSWVRLGRFALLFVGSLVTARDQVARSRSSDFTPRVHSRARARARGPPGWGVSIVRTRVYERGKFGKRRERCYRDKTASVRKFGRSGAIQPRGPRSNIRRECNRGSGGRPTGQTCGEYGAEGSSDPCIRTYRYVSAGCA